ncbi:MAG: hydrolase [Pseudomonadota bacterium]|nr:hydrolase [Pseudomonadota bacterium]
MKTFVTSDLHINHSNIIQYCQHRGNSVDEMNELIIKNWNSVITPVDRVFIIGDVAMGKIADAPPLVKRLNGTKHLILGNHDKTITKLPEFNELFASSQDYLEFTYKKEGLKQFIVMSHFPFYSFNGQHHGSMHLHGHLHSPPDKIHLFPNRRIMDVGLDGNNLFPWDMDVVVEKLRQIPMSKNHHDRSEL